MCWSIAGVFIFFSSRQTTFVSLTVISRVSIPFRLFARSFQHYPLCERLDLERMKAWTVTWWRRICDNISRCCCVSMGLHSAQTCFRCNASPSSFLAFSRFQWVLVLFSTHLKRPTFPTPPSFCLLFVHKHTKSQGPTNSTEQLHFKKSKRSDVPSLYSLPKRESSVSKRGGSFSTVSTLCK